LLALCACATTGPRAESETPADDAELEGLAAAALHQQLLRDGFDVRAFDFETKVLAVAEGGLEVRVVCSGRVDHLLKAQVKVTGRGAAARKLLPSMMAKAAKDLATDCR